MYYEVKPESNTSWGELNSVIIEASKVNTDVFLNLSEFINTWDYYPLEIPVEVVNFKILGNPKLSFNASIKAKYGRLISISLIIINLSLSIDANVPVIDIATDNKENTLLFEGKNNINNMSIAEDSINSGIAVLEGTTLYISGVDSVSENTLSVIGGVYSAGVGSGNYINAGAIYIHGANTVINSIGGDRASGIGGGISGNGGFITLDDNAQVIAYGGYYGCGIGGGFGYNVPGNSGYIKISGNSVVKALGGECGSGIGGGHSFYGIGGNLESLIICKNANVYADGDYASAGIGGGHGLANIGGDIINLSVYESATVNAYGGELGCGIGGGYGIYGGNIEELSIYGSSIVNAYGGKTAGGISGGTSGGLIGVGGSGGNITISGRSLVSAYGGEDGAGIGGGAGDIGGNGGVITIEEYSKVLVNTFLGYYKSNSEATLNICSGAISCNDLYLTDINLCGGVVAINDPNFIPTIKVDNFLFIKLIYPDGKPYIDSVNLNKIDNPLFKLNIIPNSNGEVEIYASDGSYFFETQRLTEIYKTDTFRSPYNYGTKIVLIFQIGNSIMPSRGANLFLYKKTQQY